MPANLEIQNQLDLQDFAEAERITPAWGHGFYRFSYLITRFNMVALGLFGLLMVGMVVSELGPIRSWSAGGRIALGVLLVGGILAGKFRQMWNGRYGNASLRMNSYPYPMSDSISAGEAGIEFRSGISEVLADSLAWGEFIGFHEGDRIFLLIRKGSHQELLIPKRFLAEDEQNQLRKLLEDKVGKW